MLKIAAIACLMSMPLTGAPSRFTLKEPIMSIVTPTRPADAELLAQRWGRGRRGRHNASRTAIILGSVAAVAGAAVLVYANRPECGATNHSASGCSYGTKVVGGAVLAGGVVSIAAGALTWGR
jgi:hypothetical protein